MQEILHVLIHALKHTLNDSLALLPFLFITYFLMEIIEHTSKEKATSFIKKSGRLGPFVSSVLGAVPQCGFSAAISGLYSGRVITLGTLLAVFLSTSDEMIPIMISSRFPVRSLFTVVLLKVVIGMAVGFLADFILRKKSEPPKIGHLCKEEGCHCEEGIFRSALHHTVSVFFFILAVGFALEFVIGFVGEDALARLVSGAPFVSNVICSLIALIPNCASSVVITELYMEGIISAGAMMSGLLAGAGLGTLVLFRTNKNIKENLFIMLALWLIGIGAGVILDLLNFGSIL